MMIGKLPHTSIWVSCDPRSANGPSTRYWDDDSNGITYASFDNDLEYSEALELSRFSSKKRSKPKKVQKEKQKALIKMIYYQGGKQYKRDIETVEGQKTATIDTGKRKRDTAKADKSKNTTPRKAIKVNPTSDSLLELFQHKAQEIPITLGNVSKLHRMMMDEWQNTPPTDVIKDSLEEARRLKEPNALESGSYQKWLATSGHKPQGVDIGKEEEEEESSESDATNESDTGDEDEEEEHKRGGRSAQDNDTGNDDDDEEEKEHGLHIISSREESSEDDGEADEEVAMYQSDENEGNIAGKGDEEGSMEADAVKEGKEGGMEVDTSIEEEALGTSKDGETAGAGAEGQVPKQPLNIQSRSLERTLTSPAPPADEGQALHEQHTSARGARRANDPGADLDWMSQFFNRKG